MSLIEITAPVLPESVVDATVAQWHKKPGDKVKRDENLVDLETDKVMLEVPALQDGILQEILKPEGSQAKPKEVLCIINTEVSAKTEPAATPAAAKSDTKPQAAQTVKLAEAPVATEKLSPSVRRLVGESDVDINQVKGTGKDQRITKEDVAGYLAKQPAVKPLPVVTGERAEKRVPMSRLRARIAERLVEVQHTTAMLTTFNEVNMQPVMELRAKYKDQFEKRHGIKLGMMAFFVKASVEALKRFPAVNASLDGNDVVYHGYFDIGIAVSTERGLVVPILRDADRMSLADIEKGIAYYAEKARNNKLTIEEMTGGTFTITNGGVFGSMLSTPILNAPQSAILGMHNIVKRPVAENDEVVIRPVMYLALSYDHRIVDGRESVSFLVTIKQMLEDPARLLLDV